MDQKMGWMWKSFYTYVILFFIDLKKFIFRRTLVGALLMETVSNLTKHTPLCDRNYYSTFILK